jgi:hypothetical protein
MRRAIPPKPTSFPFTGFVNGHQSPGGGTQELHLGIALADFTQIGAKIGDRFVVREKKPPLRQEGILGPVIQRLRAGHGSPIAAGSGT